MLSGNNYLKSVMMFYWNGFKSMTLGKSLWLLIAVKLFIIFVVLKIFFFPDFLRHHHGDEPKGNYVGRELVLRIADDADKDN